MQAILREYESTRIMTLVIVLLISLLSAQAGAHMGLSSPSVVGSPEVEARSILNLPPGKHAEVMLQLQSLIDTPLDPSMSFEDAQFVNMVRQWALGQRNRLIYAERMRSPEGRRSVRDEDVAKALRAAEKEAELANIELEEALTRQSETMQVISRLMKDMHDVIKAIVRNMRS